MLRWRFLLGTLIVAALAGLCWLDMSAPVPGLYLMPVVVAISLLATRETLDLLACANMRPMAPLIQAVNVLTVIAIWTRYTDYFSSPFTQQGEFSDLYFLVFSDWGLVTGIVLVIFSISEMCRRQTPTGAMGNLAGGVFAFIYIGMMLSYAIAIRMIFGIGAVAAWIITVKMCDSGAYLFGRLFGRHKLAPRISPGKTIEGAVGGLAFACLGSWLAFHFIVPLSGHIYSIIPSPRWSWLFFGLLVGAAGMFGDLAESLLKRDAGRKDSSSWMPGFGGVLDVLDSLLLSAPVAWFCWESGVLGIF